MLQPFKNYFAERDLETSKAPSLKVEVRISPSDDLLRCRATRSPEASVDFFSLQF
jgi:hypothetical protein